MHDARPAPTPVVLQVLPALGSGGVERGTVEIAEAIATAGGSALVASAGGRMAAEVERVGARHIDLPLATKNPIAIWANAERLANLIRAQGVEIVHARSRAPAWSALWAARRTGVHFVTTYHGNYGEGWPFKRHYNAVMAKGERVIAISRFIAERIAARHSVGPDRLRVIPRGVDPRRFDPDQVDEARKARLRAAWRLPFGAPVLMLPGRLSGWKGQDILIRALALLPRGHEQVMAVLVGGGAVSLADALRRNAASLGLAERVILTGDCADMPAALTLADVVVAPSTKPEAFGRAVIEAQAMARPAIAADHGGAIETIAEGRTGWRVTPGDPAALAAAIERILAMSPAARQAIGAAARTAVARDYSTEAMQRATLAVYTELCLSRSAPNKRASSRGA
jgi:glycosyltransferase involved in cell wall biosynthesis